MQSYSYRSVKAIAEHRYPQMPENRFEPAPIAPNKTWPNKIWHEVIRQDRSKRKRGANNRAPDRSRAA